MLEIQEELFLSDIDEPPSRSIRSAIVVVSSTDGSVCESKLDNQTEPSVNEQRQIEQLKRAQFAQGDRSTDNSLFPNSPKRRQAFDKNYRIPRNPAKVAEDNLFCRKPTFREKHSSDSRKFTNSRGFTDSRQNKYRARNARQPNKFNQISTEELKKKRERLRVAIANVKSKSAPPRRSIKVVDPSFARLGPPVPVASTSAQPKPTLRDASTQTDPTRSQLALREKNKKRREQAKSDRKIVRQLGVKKN